MTLARRDMLRGATLAMAALSRSGRVLAADADTLRFVPVADLTVLDPYFALPDVTAEHCNVVYDMLWGMDESLTPQLQMLQSAECSPDGLRWTLTLREGLGFHDDSAVEAADVVASIRKWASRDSLGQKLLQATDALAAPSPMVVQFSLKRPFPLLPTALAKPAAFGAYILPRRIAEAAGTGKPIAPIGSGPYRYIAAERVVGARAVYERFDGYRPRAEPPSYLAGGKIPFFRRIVWNVIPDPATAAAALQADEADWLAEVSPDVAPLLRRRRDTTVQVQDLIGGDLIMRFNALWPPFDDAAVRRAVLPAVQQSDFMQAVAGDDRSLWRDRVGVFGSGKPMSTDVGVEVMAGDVDRARQLLKASGYRGQRIVVMAASDYPSLSAAAAVGADMLGRIGFAVDLQSIDYGTMMQRRENRAEPGRGGWNVFFAWFSGFNRYIPPTHLGLAANFPGWVKVDAIETLRDRWIAESDLATRQELAREIQLLVWQQVPFVPLGTYFPMTAFRTGLHGVEKVLAQFTGVSRG